jgi:hypothetical protein
MNALTSIDATHGRQFREHPTQIDTWIVTVDGEEAGTIERDGNQFIARAGRPHFTRTFNQALDTIAEVVRHNRALEASTASLSDKEAKIARLEQQKACLAIGAASCVDVAARSDAIDRRIVLVRGAVL